jgi:hypothetical protein
MNEWPTFESIPGTSEQLHGVEIFDKRHILPENRDATDDPTLRGWTIGVLARSMRDEYSKY